MNFKFKLKMISAAISATILSGCTGVVIPESADKEYEKSMNNDSLINDWKNMEPAITYLRDNTKIVVEHPEEIPDYIYNKHFSSNASETSTIGNLAGLLRPMGVYISIPDEKIRDKPLAMFEFDGKLGDYLRALGASYEISFNWHPGNIITIDKTSTYMVRIPQNKEIADAIEKNIKALGAESSDISLEAGIISYKADYKNQERIKSFMKFVSDNSAIVSMQIAVITVALDKSTATGIDWSQLSFGLGKAAAYQNASGYDIDQSDDDDDDDDDDTSSTVSATDLLLTGSGLSNIQSLSSIGGTSSSVFLANNNFSVSAVVDYLSSYGNTKTTQSVLMKTLSGKNVKLKSATTIPYISSVGVTTSSSSSDLGLGTANVDSVDVGLSLILSPYYQDSNSMITIDVDLTLSALLSYLTLSAGDQLGSLTYPNVQEQEFTDLIKMKAGETAIIGGITYDQRSSNINTPYFLEDVGGGHSEEDLTRTAMIIMIRPSVVAFKPMENESEKVIN